MHKSTLFIAVQCCQCSTMQVKQQKKSSNKWNCVVCNQKQSVKKIYAQGYQAKDIRNVVQSFNMSRKLEDDQLNQQQFPSIEHLEDNPTTTTNKANPRTDWSEYIEHETNSLEPAYLKSKFNEKEMVAEPKIVTEFSDDFMFKKCKLKGKFGSSLRSFDKKTPEKSQGKSSRHGTFWDEESVNNNDIIRGVGLHSEKQQREEKVSTMRKDSASKLIGGMKLGASKWNKYITYEDDDGSLNGGKGVGPTDLSFMCGYNQLESVDQLVEEDVHPDFM